MSYTAVGITEIRTVEFDGGLVVQARSAHSDKVVQCYVAGKLLDWQDAPAEPVQFVLPGVAESDLIFLLAVDTDEAETDYWDEAFDIPASHGSRIHIRTPQTVAPYLPGDRWRVYLGGAGDAEADTLVWEQAFYPGGRRACGWGAHFSDGGFGWDAVDAKGYGYNLGYGEFGLDCEMLEYESDPMEPRTYPYKVTVVDEAGNPSAATEGTVTLDTYARPAAGLTVESYEKPTDTLRLSFTPSEDLS